jgi:hypothetical protein
MQHVILLGDSIFDNAAYVPGGPSVIEHLQRCLPALWRGSLLAVDGSVTDQIAEQLTRLPTDATHLVISTGGNDALCHAATILRESAESYAEVLDKLAQMREEFQRSYRAMLQTVLSLGKPTVLCTVYDVVGGISPAEHAGLCLFNDVILREAIRAALPVIDIRLICTDAADYSSISPIEPSVAGGGKIARAISRVVPGQAFGAAQSQIYT